MNFVPAHPDVKTEPALAEVLKGAKIFPIDDDYAGANRKRIVDRWVEEVLPSAVTSWPAAAAGPRGAGSRRDPALLGAIVVLSGCCWRCSSLYPLVDAAGARLRRRRPVHAWRRCSTMPGRSQPSRAPSSTACCSPRSVGVLGTALGFLFAFTAVRAGLGRRLAAPCSTRRRCCRWSRRRSPPRSRSSSRSDRGASSPTTCWASPSVTRLRLLRARTLAETLTYFPIAYLTLRPILAAIDRQSRGDGVQPRRLALAHLPHRDPAAGRAGLRQRVPAAVRGLARRFRDAADPGRQFLPGAADAGLSCRSPACSTSRAARCCRSSLLVPAAAVFLLQRYWVGRAHLRHRDRQGAASARASAAIAPAARCVLIAACVAGRARSSSISMRCCSTPRWSWPSAPTTRFTWRTTT